MNYDNEYTQHTYTANMETNREEEEENEQIISKGCEKYTLSWGIQIAI